jgi:hypothetical protein
MYKIIHLLSIVSVLLLTGCSSRQTSKNSQAEEILSTKTNIQKADSATKSTVNEAIQTKGSTSVTTTTVTADTVTEKKQEYGSARDISLMTISVILLVSILILILFILNKSGAKKLNLDQLKNTIKKAEKSESACTDQIITVNKLILNLISELKIFKNINLASNPNESITTLSKQVSLLEKESQKLCEIIIKKDQKSTLSRVCSAYETANFIRKSISTKKMSNQDSVEELLIEIDSMFNDVGLQIYTIQIGEKISKLPYGSFEILGVAEMPESENSAGTVKEVISSAIYVTDSNGQPHFIAPAKIKAYKL